MTRTYADVAIVGTDTLYDIDAVKQSIITILKTNKGERLFRPSFGSNLEDLLWRPMSEVVADDIKSEIIANVLQDYRATITELGVTADYINNCYNVMVNISVNGVESSVDMILKKRGL